MQRDQTGNQATNDGDQIGPSNSDSLDDDTYPAYETGSHLQLDVLWTHTCDDEIVADQTLDELCKVVDAVAAQSGGGSEEASRVYPLDVMGGDDGVGEDGVAMDDRSEKGCVAVLVVA